MDSTGSGLLSVVVFLPLAAAVLVALVVSGDKAVRQFVGLVSLVELALSIAVFVLYDRDGDRFQMVDRVTNWIPIDSFEVQYFIGVDGLSAPLVFLTGILGMVAVFASWGIRYRVREYFVWLLILQTAVMGVFTSLDFILFFLMWELELIPMFFLIAIWGGGRKEYSAMKFLVFTFLGSAFMLVGILALFFTDGINTFDMTKLPEAIKATSDFAVPLGLIFALMFIAFAVKLPVWPLHTWLPDAHTDAPTAVSVMLAGVLLKMGGYGMIRVSAEMFPEVIRDVAWLLIVAGTVNVLYGAVVTVRQTDLKRLIAFSSISHMGYVLVGLSSVVGAGSLSTVGLTGAAMQMFTHGTITGLLFLVVGLVYDKVHTRYIPDMGGLAARMPVLTVAFLVAGLASLGLPGTSGFVSEVMVFLGTFPVWGLGTALAAFGIVVTAGYILWMLQRTFFGPRINHFDNVRDARPMEMVPIAVLVIVILGVGIYPAVISDVFMDGIVHVLGGTSPEVAVLIP